MWISLIILLAAVGTLGDFFIKIAGIHPKADIQSFVIGLLIYAATAFGWFFAMRHVKLSELGALYAISTVIILALISVLYFKEPMNLGELIGIILGILSIVLLAKFT